MNLLLLIPWTTEEITFYINEAAKDVNIAPRNAPSCFFVLCFTVSVAPSINIPESSSHFMILIKSLISFLWYHLKWIKWILFLLLKPLSHVFYFILSKTDKVALFSKLVANLGNTSLVRGTAKSNKTFLSKSSNALPRNPPDWIILDSFPKFYIYWYIFREDISYFSFLFWC